MSNSAAAARHRQPHTARPGLTPGASARLVLGGTVLLAALAISLALILRSGPSASRPTAGSEHARGPSTAPLLVEEWSDFE